jgi:hypothetical protein
MRAHVGGCLQHTARPTTLPSAQWSQAVSDYSNANVHAAPVPPAVRTRMRMRTRMVGGPTRRTSVRTSRTSPLKRISTCRSQCDGDRTHPVWEEGTCAASSAAFLLATACLACRTRASCRTATPGEGPTPTQIFGGPKMSREKCLRDYRRIARASKFGAWDGAAVQVCGAKRDGDARWCACGAWGVQPRRAARRRPQRLDQRPERACPST